MRVRAIIRRPKSITKAGKWRCGANSPAERMTKTSFPLSARKGGYILGSAWWWRVDEVMCGDTPGRLLTAFRPDKRNYIAWLSVPRGNEHVIVACFEYHGDHGNFHWHSKCSDLSDFAAGAERQRNGGIRIPRKGRYTRPRAFVMSPQTATEIAYKAFRITAKPEGALL